MVQQRHAETGNASAGLPFRTLIVPFGRIVAHCLSMIERAVAFTPAWAGIVSAVLALQLGLIVTHVPWLDEWQALQIAVQSPTMADLLQNLRYEGHPPLWYLILRGTARMLGDPAAALPVTAALLAMIVQGAILLAAPLRRADRLLLALSEFVLFEFLTISRSMTLGVACAVLAMAL